MGDGSYLYFVRNTEIHPQSADGIALYISNSPFVSWLSIFGIRGEANLLGIVELTTAALLAAGAFIPILSALGSLMGIGTFAITWSFSSQRPVSSNGACPQTQ
jgi:uncharacterized membrane protein YkgB